MGNHNAKRGQSAAARGFGGPELRVKPPSDKPEFGKPINEAPAGGKAPTAEGAGGKNERRSKKNLRPKVVAALAGVVAVAGILQMASGSDHHEVPTTPNVLTTGGSETALQAATRKANNGEHGETVLAATGIVTYKSKDGKLVSTAHPIVELSGLGDAVAAQAKAGHFDVKSLGDRIFRPNVPTNTPVGDHDNYDRGFTVIPSADIVGYTPGAPDPVDGDQLIEVSLPANHAGNEGNQPGTQDPYDISLKTGAIGQHNGSGGHPAKGYAEFVVGQEVPTPQQFAPPR
ncbi:MAG: hypothetical protein ABWY71_01600 [Candidatus Saccharimonadales bacterium]